jgi:hypothetical protein
VEVTFTPTIKVETEQEYEIWEDAESTVKVVLEANSQKDPYRYMNDDILSKAEGRVHFFLDY